MKTFLKNLGWFLIYVITVFLIVGTIKNYVCAPYIK